MVSRVLEWHDSVALRNHTLVDDSALVELYFGTRPQQATKCAEVAIVAVFSEGAANLPQRMGKGLGDREVVPRAELQDSGQDSEPSRSKDLQASRPPGILPP